MCVGSLCEWLLCLLSVEGTSQSEVAAASQLVEVFPINPNNWSSKVLHMTSGRILVDKMNPNSTWGGAS